jgi:hypothetical protein
MLKNPILGEALEHVITINILNWLVVLTILKNMKVSWDYYSQYIMENNKCSKPPPTSKNHFWHPQKSRSSPVHIGAPRRATTPSVSGC